MRIAAAWTATLFLILVGTTASQAYWTTGQQNVSISGSSGSVEATQTGLSSLSGNWTKNTLTSTTAVRITNTGTLDASWRYTLSSPSAVVAATTFTTWVTSGTTCTNSTAVPSGATTATGSLPAALTGQFAPSASVTMCVRASTTAQGEKSYGSQSLAVTGTLDTWIGNWPGGGVATATISITDDNAPSTPSPVIDRVSGYSARLTWAASTDNVGVSGYRVYRGTTLMATLGSTATTWTDASLAGNTAYSFQVEAFDAAGNTARSSATSATTLNLNSNGRYDFYASYANRCLDVEGYWTSIGTAATIWDCHGGLNQLFILRPMDDGSYQLEPQHATSTALGTADSSYGTVVRLMAKTSGSTTDPRTRWVAEPLGNGFAFKNQASGLYLDIEGISTAAGAKATQWGYTGAGNQTFVLRAK